MANVGLTEADLMAIEKMVEDAIKMNEQDGDNFYAWALLDQLLTKVRAALTGNTVELPVEPPSLEVTGNSVPIEPTATGTMKWGVGA